MGIIQGTTPTLVMKTNIDLTNFNVIVTLKQNNFVMNFKDERLVIIPSEEESIINLTLTQEETLNLINDVDLKIQWKGNFIGAEKPQVVASKIANVSVREVLNRQEIL